MTYAEVSDIEKRIGITFSSSTQPTLTEVQGMLANADEIINAEAKVTSNMTDNYGILKNIAINLVLKMIINYWSFRDPENFAYVDVELSPFELRQIHKTMEKFEGETFDLGS
ncbi:MAG: hypothetical protein ACTSUK_03870 [Promethearchaeota archaeon]